MYTPMEKIIIKDGKLPIDSDNQGHGVAIASKSTLCVVRTFYHSRLWDFSASPSRRKTRLKWDKMSSTLDSIDRR